MLPLVARHESERVQRMPVWAPGDAIDKVGWKARPLCAGVSVTGTMRALRHNVDARGKTYIAASALRLRPAVAISLLKLAFARPRPYLVTALTQALTLRFPRGHAARS